MTTNPKQKLVWVEPLGRTDLSPVPSGVMSATVEDVVLAQKQAFPERNYTDEGALDDFMAVNWASFEASPAIPSGEQVELETTEEERANLLVASLASTTGPTSAAGMRTLATTGLQRVLRDFAKLQARAIPSLETPEERQAKIVAEFRDEIASIATSAQASMTRREVISLLNNFATALESGDYLRTGGGE